MSNHDSTVTLAIVVVLLTAVFLFAGVISISAYPSGPTRYPTGPLRYPSGPLRGAVLDAPIATSGNNTYIAWPNNDTGHFNVFFAKSTDGGKTLKTMMISAPNKGHTIDQNTEISASGNHVYVTWWTNKTGTLMPVFRASNDNGDTFGKDNHVE